MQTKNGAASQRALRLNFSAMLPDDPEGNGQAEARAAGFTRTRMIGTIETLEDMRQILFGNSDAGVAYFNDCAALFAGEVNVYAATLRSIFHGVFENDEQKALERPLIRRHP